MIKVDGKDFPWREGLTLADVVSDLKIINWIMRLNGRPVTKKDFDKTLVPDCSEIYTLMIVGG